MMITYQVEGWERYYNDPARHALWLEHYTALEPAHEGSMPMQPHIPFYAGLDAAGALITLVARAEGQMVGYCLVAIRPHPHYSTPCGFEDSYYLTPKARRGMAGVRLILESLRELKRRGVRRSYWMTKEFASIAAIFERLGMKKMDTVYVHVES